MSPFQVCGVKGGGGAEGYQRARNTERSRRNLRAREAHTGNECVAEDRGSDKRGPKSY